MGHQRYAGCLGRKAEFPWGVTGGKWASALHWMPGAKGWVFWWSAGSKCLIGKLWSIRIDRHSVSYPIPQHTSPRQYLNTSSQFTTICVAGGEEREEGKWPSQLWMLPLLAFSQLWKAKKIPAIQRRRLRRFGVRIAIGLSNCERIFGWNLSAFYYSICYGYYIL